MRQMKTDIYVSKEMIDELTEEIYREGNLKDYDEYECQKKATDGQKWYFLGWGVPNMHMSLIARRRGDVWYAYDLRFEVRYELASEIVKIWKLNERRAALA